MPLGRECTVGLAPEHRDGSERIALARHDWPQPGGFAYDHMASRERLHRGKLLRAYASDFFICGENQRNRFRSGGEVNFAEGRERAGEEALYVATAAAV